MTTWSRVITPTTWIEEFPGGWFEACTPWFVAPGWFALTETRTDLTDWTEV